ncbi:substrate-binding domain-containing protein [Streptomyces thinghirensis]|nr:substrate-binding domain-containing protein [Streptomyces thinghirensis]
MVTNLANPFYSPPRARCPGSRDAVRPAHAAQQLRRAGRPGTRTHRRARRPPGRRADRRPGGNRQQHLARAAGGTSRSSSPRGRPPDWTPTASWSRTSTARAATACLLAEGHTTCSPPRQSAGALHRRRASAGLLGGTRGDRHRAGPRPHPPGPGRLRDRGGRQRSTCSGRPNRPPRCSARTTTSARARSGPCTRPGTTLPPRRFRRLDLSDVLGLPLTLVSYDADEIGRQAARLLIDRLEHHDTAPPASRRISVPTRVVRHGTPSGQQPGRPPADA